MSDKATAYEDFDVDAATEKFFEVLFSLMPGIEALFSDIEAQKRMFATAIKIIVTHKHDDKDLQKYLRLLGEKHKRFGIQRLHMEKGLQAFYAALRAGNPNLSSKRHNDYMDLYLTLQRNMGFGS